MGEMIRKLVEVTKKLNNPKTSTPGAVVEAQQSNKTRYQFPVGQYVTWRDFSGTPRNGKIVGLPDLFDDERVEYTIECQDSAIDETFEQKVDHFRLKKNNTPRKTSDPGSSTGN